MQTRFGRAEFGYLGSFPLSLMGLLRGSKCILYWFQSDRLVDLPGTSVTQKPIRLLIAQENTSVLEFIIQWGFIHWTVTVGQTQP